MNSGNRVYTVRPGDTLWSIAREYLGSPYRWKEIWDANRYVVGPDPTHLYVNQRLLIPPVQDAIPKHIIPFEWEVKDREEWLDTGLYGSSQALPPSSSPKAIGWRGAFRAILSRVRFGPWKS